jgi:hypothetical protein
MKEFLLVFRTEHKDNTTAEKGGSTMEQWQEWMGGLAAKNHLVNMGNPLEGTGKVVKANGSFINGPYVETKEAIGGFTIIQAASLDEAAALCKGCPIFIDGGNVEVRPVIPM